ncbi:FAD-dependent oxidoreductase [Candidatus Saccharibacteria bacterium]|nr:FAD-dependent oxidoreductase [Candidatus Saccharibacteria bacterium]
MATKKKRVLILGGGFGGIKVALELAGHPDYEITLVSDQDNFRYYPQLYHAATGGSRYASEIPLQEIFAGKDIRLVKGSVKRLDRQTKAIECRAGKKYKFDSLVVALGVTTNFFGIKGLAQNAYGIKTLDEAKRLRAHLHKLIADEGQPDLNYIIIGGGSTGVELAGALPAYLQLIMKNHDIKDKSLHIELVEAEKRVLPKLPRSYSQAAQKRLRRLGVTLHLGQKVEAETADALRVNGRNIKSHTVVWTAGVTNHSFFKDNEFHLTSQGKAIVDQYLQAEPDIYVIGDNADTKYSGMAQTALYDGKFVAGHLKAAAEGKKIRPYKAKKPVYITPVGPHWAAVLWGKTHIYGFLGWILRSAADFIAYHDLQPWWKASKRWRTTFDTEEDCPICSGKR